MRGKLGACKGHIVHCPFISPSPSITVLRSTLLLCIYISPRCSHVCHELAMFCHVCTTGSPEDVAHHHAAQLERTANSVRPEKDVRKAEKCSDEP